MKLKKREIKIEKLEELIKERDRIMNDVKSNLVLKLESS